MVQNGAFEAYLTSFGSIRDASLVHQLESVGGGF